jgi:hypothetical protein
MDEVRDKYFKELWRDLCDLQRQYNDPAIIINAAPLSELVRTDWSPEFERLMRNRLIQGSFRYGRLGKDKAGMQFDRVASIKRRLANYEATGNIENLVDIANTALLEFVEGIHPAKHFHSTDDGVHDEKL